MKKICLAILAIFCFISSPCLAQHTDLFVIDNFSKMLQSQVSPYLLPKGAAAEARNVRANDVYGSLGKRREMLDYGSTGFAITSMHRFYQSDATVQLLITGSTYIKLGNDDTGAFTTLRDELTDGARWTWITYKDKAIGCNGVDNCQKYDGITDTTADTNLARTAGILTTDLGAPFASITVGAGLDASSWYQYKVGFYNGTTYSYSTARSNPLLLGSSLNRIWLTDIPLGPSGTTHRYVYRTLGNASRADVEADTTYYLVKTFANNTTVVLADSVTDDVADNDASPTWATVQTTNLTPPIVKYITLHKERIFGANAPSYNSYIYWSYAFKPDIFDPADFDYVRVGDGDEITFIKELRGMLVIGKTNTITNLNTRNADDTLWPFYTMSHIGCPAPYSAVQTPLGIIYLSSDGLYVYNKETSQLISDVVTQEIRDIADANIDEVVGVYFRNEYQMAYTSKSSGASENDVVLIFDTVRDAYVVDDKTISAFEVFDASPDYGVLYSGDSTSTGNIWAHQESPNEYVVRYKSDLDAGTKDSIVIEGTEVKPETSLGWGITINSITMVNVTLNSITYNSATINRNSTTGYWWSPGIRVDASNYEKLYWNESLGAYGNITFAIRSAASSSTVTDDSLAWSSEFSDPSGSDISGETANDYIQVRSTLTTSNIAYTPTLDSSDNHVFRLIYEKIGIGTEGNIESLWQSGFMDFGSPTVLKRIWGIDVRYTGTSGTLTFGLKNDEGDVDTSFDIDLSANPSDSNSDQYYGLGPYKIYDYLVPINSEDDSTPIGRRWEFSIEESGVEGWNVYEIVVRYSKEDFYDRQ